MNVSNNITTTRSEISSDEAEIFTTSTTDVLLCVVACLLSIFVCTGNILTVLAIVHTPTLRTLANTYVASLAVADFVVGLTMILLALFLLPTTRVDLFYRSINLCVFMQGTNIGMTAVSTIHMTIISVDRYMYITHPYVYQRLVSYKVVIGFVSFAWIFGIFYSILPQIIHKPYGKVPKCDITRVLPIEYLFYTTFAVYWSLVTVIVIMYSLILHTALKQRKAIQSTQATNTCRTAADGDTGHTLRKSTTRSIRFFLTVFGVFFVCLTPVLVCLALDFYIVVPANLYRFFNILALTNSGMNFIIYGVLNKEFRRAFFKMMRIQSSPCQNKNTKVFSMANSVDFTTQF